MDTDGSILSVSIPISVQNFTSFFVIRYKRRAFMRRTSYRVQRIVGILVLAFALIGCTDTPVSQPVSQSIAEPQATEADAEVSDLTLELARDIDVQTAASVLERDDIFLLDVREPWEHEERNIVGNTLIPTGAVADRLAEIPTDKEVIIYCHSGARSARITAYLEQQGYTNVHNMLGGIVAWEGAGFEVE